MPHHIQPQEAQEVVRLATLRQSGAPGSGPTVEGLAEALDLPPDEVERLLAEVRGRQSATPPTGHVPKRVFGDRSAAISAGIVLALLVVFGLIVAFGVNYAAKQEARSTPSVSDAAAAQPFVIDDGEGGRVEIGEKGIIVHGTDKKKTIVIPSPPTPPAP